MERSELSCAHGGAEGEEFEAEAETLRALQVAPDRSAAAASSVFKALLLSDGQLFLMKEEKTINWK